MAGLKEARRRHGPPLAGSASSSIVPESHHSKNLALRLLSAYGIEGELTLSATTGLSPVL